MISFPNSKINLGLNVVRKRNDGFHDIETLMYPVPFRDVLEIIPAKDGIFEFSVSGIPIPQNGKPNLCERAFFILDSPPVKILLHKVIPPGTGLGAGSANAAFTLVMLNNLFNLGLSKRELKEKALALGSDCPFFVDNIPAIAKGRGEILESADINLSGLYLVIITSNISVSTARAYSLIKPGKPDESIHDIARKPLSNWKELLKNDFEAPIFVKHPILAKIKEWLYKNGAAYASMSGSGSAMFGLFDKKPDLESFKGLKPLVFRL